MKRMITKSLALVALVGGMTAYATSNAEAALTLMVCNDAACSGGGDLTFVDGVDDASADGTIGAASFISGTVNGMEFWLTGALSKPALASGMDLNFQVNNTAGAAASIWFKAVDDNFAGSGLLGAGIGGTSDSGTVFAEACQIVGGCTDSGLLVGSGQGNAFSASWGVGPAGSDPYSMSLYIAVVGLNSGDTASGDFRVIPEPMALSLLGLGLAGVAARRRRQVR